MNKKLLTTIICFLFVVRSHAWIYPEHRFIAMLAIQQLDSTYRSSFERLWSDARKQNVDRLTNLSIDTAQGRKPKQLDFASWPAIAGDHSCSSSNMLYNVLETGWILKVADVAARLDRDIQKSTRRSKHINAIRNSDIRLQRADPGYATRAGSNNVHFLLSRYNVNITALAYRDSCMIEGSALNAIGMYSWYHSSAKRKAMKYSEGNLSEEEKTKVILSALADEAFALHFLEDVFAAGHIAGSWGVASVRKGTHDFYNEKGLEVVTWEGKRIVMRGDAFMNPDDASFAAQAIKMSLEQFIDAATGRSTVQSLSTVAMDLDKPDTFNVCSNNYMPKKIYDDHDIGLVLVKTPVPGLATGAGELPRFRSELGLFLGISTGVDGSGISGGFGAGQTDAGVTGGLEIDVRVGLGLDGVINEAGDGLIFIQGGIRSDQNSSNRIANASGATIPPGAITSAIPGRTGLTFRARMPFWLIPGDLLVAGPVLLLISPKTLAKMAVTAGNGGAIPWQSGIATRIGRFQFILGREVGISYFGTGSESKDALIIPGPTQNYMVNYRSTKYDFPILEYRPFQSFSMNQSSSIKFQLTFGFDVPHDATTIYPEGGAVPELKTVTYLGFRLLFDWRHYL
jgi:hypothetical protein